MKISKSDKYYSGQSLFEVILAVGVMALISVTIVGLSSTSTRNSTYSRNNLLANRYAEEGMEWLRQTRDRNWGPFWAHSKNKNQGGRTICLDILSEDNTNSSWYKVTQNSNSDQPCTDTMFVKDPAGNNTIFYREVNLSRVGEDENKIEVNLRVWWNDAQGTHEVRSMSYFTNWQKRP